MSLRAILDAELGRRFHGESRPMRDVVRHDYDRMASKQDRDIAGAPPAQHYYLDMDDYVAIEARRVQYAADHGGEISGAECDRIRDDYARERGLIK